jgi:hypothetical protein
MDQCAGSAPNGDVKLFSLVHGVFASPLYWKPTPPQDKPTKEDVLEAAVCHAVTQFLSALHDGSVEEEHSSAALMGYLGGCVNIYNLLSVLSGGEQTKVLWNVQKSKGSGSVQFEAVTGGDFGIVFPTEVDDTYRLAFFQAKKQITQAGGIRFDIRHLSGSGYSRDLNKDEIRRVKQANKKKVKEAQESETKKKTPDGWSEDARLLSWIASGSVKQGAKFHQILKLAHTQSNGWKYVKEAERQSWVHYVIWPVAEVTAIEEDADLPRPPEFLKGFPLSVSLESVRDCISGLDESDLGFDGISKRRNPFVRWDGENIEEGRNKEEQGDKDVVNDAKLLTCPSFLDVLRAGIRGGDGWLTVSSKCAAELIGKISTVGSEWVVLDDKDGGLIGNLRDYGLVVSSNNPEIENLSMALANRFSLAINPAYKP